MTFRALMLGIAFLPVPAFAADVDGKWVGSIALPTGDITLTYKFNAVGNTLTGSMAAPDGTETVISDGKIEGDKLSFAGTIMFVGRPFLVAYTGVLAGKEIKLTVDIGGQAVDFIVKKE